VDVYYLGWSIRLGKGNDVVRTFSLLFLLFFAASAWSPSHAIAAAKRVAIIASSDVTPLNMDQLKNVYSLKQKLLPNQAPIKLVQLPLNNKVTQDFTRHLFELYPYQLQRIWDRQVYSGRARAPKLIETEGKVFAHLSTSSNTIAYVSANSALFIEYKGKINVLATF